MKVPRRNLVKGGLAASVAFAPQIALAQQAGRRFKAWVSRGFGRNTTTLQELTLLPISGRQVVVRTEVTQCCYTMAGRMMGTQDPPTRTARRRRQSSTIPTSPPSKAMAGWASWKRWARKCGACSRVIV